MIFCLFCQNNKQKINYLYSRITSSRWQEEKSRLVFSVIGMEDQGLWQWIDSKFWNLDKIYGATLYLVWFRAEHFLYQVPNSLMCSRSSQFRFFWFVPSLFWILQRFEFGQRSKLDIVFFANFWLFENNHWPFNQ